MTTAAHPITADELLAMGDIGRCELIRGEIIHMAPSGAEHGDLALGIGSIIRSFVRQHRLGKTYAAETGFRVAQDPDTVRAPDVAFVKAARVPRGSLRGFFPGAPDLAVEVVSPTDRSSDVLAKVNDWLRAGTTSVWVVDPPSRSITIYRSGRTILRYEIGDRIENEPVLPGFGVPVAELFE